MKKEKQLLKVLEDDARLSTKGMANMLNMSEKKVREMIKRLEKEKMIRGYKTIVDWKKAGSKLVTAVIQVKVEPEVREGFARICKEISKDDRVQDLFVATGEYDLIVVVEAEDIENISRFVTEKLAPKKEVTGTNTHIVLSKFKRNGVKLFDDEAKRLPISL